MLLLLVLLLCLVRAIRWGGAQVKGKNLGYFASHSSHDQDTQDTCRAEIEKSRLSSLKHVHHGHGGHKAENVGHETGDKVGFGKVKVCDLCASLLLASQMVIKLET